MSVHRRHSLGNGGDRQILGIGTKAESAKMQRALLAIHATAMEAVRTDPLSVEMLLESMAQVARLAAAATRTE